MRKRSRAIVRAALGKAEGKELAKRKLPRSPPLRDVQRQRTEWEGNRRQASQLSVIVSRRQHKNECPPPFAAPVTELETLPHSPPLKIIYNLRSQTNQVKEFFKQEEAFSYCDSTADPEDSLCHCHQIGRCASSSERSLPLWQRSNLWVYAREIGQGGKRSFLVASHEDVLQYIQSTNPDKRHFYEVIREGFPCRLYLDLECSRELNSPIMESQRIESFGSLLLRMLQQTFSICCEETLEQFWTRVLILESSTENKFSQHWIIHLPYGAMFISNEDLGEFIKLMFTRAWLDFDSDPTGSHRLLFVRTKPTHTPDDYRNDPLSCSPKTKEINEATKAFLLDAQDEICNSNDTNISIDWLPDPEELSVKQIATRLHDKGFAFLADLGVYTKNRCFRLYGSTKLGKNIPLSVFTHSVFVGADDERSLFFSSLASYIPRCQGCPWWKYWDMPASAVRTLGDQRSVDDSDGDVDFMVPLLRIPSKTRTKRTALLPGTVGRSRRISEATDKFANLAAFVLHLWSHIAGVADAPRKRQYDDLSSEGISAALKAIDVFGGLQSVRRMGEMLVFVPASNRYCMNMKRVHKRNSIMLVVSLELKTVRQKCFDPDCRAMEYQSRTWPLPDNLVAQDLCVQRDIHEEETVELLEMTAMVELQASWDALLDK